MADLTSGRSLRNGATVMRWRTELRLSGVLGRLSGPGLHAVAKHQAERTLEEVRRRL